MVLDCRALQSKTLWRLTVQLKAFQSMIFQYLTSKYWALQCLMSKYRVL